MVLIQDRIQMTYFTDFQEILAVILVKLLVSWVQGSTTQSIGHQDLEHSIIGIMINWSIRAILHTPLTILSNGKCQSLNLMFIFHFQSK